MALCVVNCRRDRPPAATVVRSTAAVQPSRTLDVPVSSRVSHWPEETSHDRHVSLQSQPFRLLLFYCSVNPGRRRSTGLPWASMSVLQSSPVELFCSMNRVLHKVLSNSLPPRSAPSPGWGVERGGKILLQGSADLRTLNCSFVRRVEKPPPASIRASSAEPDTSCVFARRRCLEAQKPGAPI